MRVYSLLVHDASDLKAYFSNPTDDWTVVDLRGLGPESFTISFIIRGEGHVETCARLTRVINEIMDDHRKKQPATPAEE